MVFDWLSDKPVSTTAQLYEPERRLSASSLLTPTHKTNLSVDYLHRSWLPPLHPTQIFSSSVSYLLLIKYSNLIFSPLTYLQFTLVYHLYPPKYSLIYPLHRLHECDLTKTLIERFSLAETVTICTGVVATIRALLPIWRLRTFRPVGLTFEIQ